MTIHNPPVAGTPVPIDLTYVLAHLASQPRLARRFVADLADTLIQQLDAIEPDPDLEPSFGYLPDGAKFDECEMDFDGEASLGWSAGHSQVNLGTNTEDGDLTALERHGQGFVRSGPDDAEPWLGAPEINVSCRAVHFINGRWCSIQIDQTTWAKGANDDREDVNDDGTDIDAGEDGDDNGIADSDGYQDQKLRHVLGDVYV